VKCWGRSAATSGRCCSNAVSTSGTLEPRAALAAMQYNELLARRIVAEVARSSVDGGASQPVMLHEVARRLKINEASVEAATYRPVAERWLIVEGSSLYRIRLTAAGQLCCRRDSRVTLSVFGPFPILCHLCEHRTLAYWSVASPRFTLRPAPAGQGPPGSAPPCRCGPSLFCRSIDVAANSGVEVARCVGGAV
jgi:hypothetical protein